MRQKERKKKKGRQRVKRSIKIPAFSGPPIAVYVGLFLALLDPARRCAVAVDESASGLGS